MGKISSKILNILDKQNSSEEIHPSKRFYSFLSIKSFKDRSSVISDSDEWNLTQVNDTKIYCLKRYKSDSEFLKTEYSFESNSSESHSTSRETRESCRWRKSKPGHWTPVASSIASSSIHNRGILGLKQTSIKNDLCTKKMIENIPLQYNSSSENSTVCSTENYGDNRPYIYPKGTEINFSRNKKLISFNQKNFVDKYLENTRFNNDEISQGDKIRSSKLECFHENRQHELLRSVNDKGSLLSLQLGSSAINSNKPPKVEKYAKNQRDIDLINVSETSPSYFEMQNSKKLVEFSRPFSKSQLNDPKNVIPQSELKGVSCHSDKRMKKKKKLSKHRPKLDSKSLSTDEYIHETSVKNLGKGKVSSVKSSYLVGAFNHLQTKEKFKQYKIIEAPKKKYI